MKFTINSSPLNKAIKPLLKVIPAKASDTVLEQMLIEAKDNKVQLSITNYEVTITTLVANATVEEEGAVLVDAKTLAGYLSGLSDEGITFTKKDNAFTITWLNGETVMAAYDEKDFRKVLPMGDNIKSYDVDAPSFLSALEATIPATATDDLRPVMTCVALDMWDGVLNLVASDAKILTVREVDVIKTDEGNWVNLLNRVPAGILKEIIKDATRVRVSFNDKELEFRSDFSSVRVIQTQGAYPAWRTIVPEKSNGSVTVKRSDLASSLRRLSSVSDQRRITCTIKNDKLVIESKDLTKSAKAVETIEAKVEGDDSIRISFYLPVFNTAIDNTKAEMVTLNYTESVRAAVMKMSGEKAEKGFSIIMPVIENN